ncbi:hypothetical protein SDC9_107277 [bioreactor metagenome]|uniref:Uncharacterized protein n=1 Tax=bioreactor metagenome TaxID=1076179 RepID=A0A645B5U3_9ZZZZ
MGEAKRGQRLVLIREGVQSPCRFDQTGQDKFHRLTQNEDIRVIPHIAAGRPQVNDRPGQRTGIGKGMDMGHHVMAQLLFIAGCSVIVDAAGRGFHLGDLLV